MNSKGELLVEETLKMIISVIAIGFLVFFLVSLYFSKAQGNELIQAQADINQLSRNIRAGANQIILNNPVGWSLFSFVGENIPNACAGQNCLCVCDEVIFDFSLGFIDNSQFSECNKNGACVAIKNLGDFEPIEIDNQVTNIKISVEDNKVVLSR